MFNVFLPAFSLLSAHPSILYPLFPLEHLMIASLIAFFTAYQLTLHVDLKVHLIAIIYNVLLLFSLLNAAFLQLFEVFFPQVIHLLSLVHEFLEAIIVIGVSQEKVSLKEVGVLEGAL
jgi:hypothetical protein